MLARGVTASEASFIVTVAHRKRRAGLRDGEMSPTRGVAERTDGHTLGVLLPLLKILSNPKVPRMSKGREGLKNRVHGDTCRHRISSYFAGRFEPTNPRRTESPPSADPPPLMISAMLRLAGLGVRCGVLCACYFGLSSPLAQKPTRAHSRARL